MRLHAIVFRRGGFGAYLALVLGCGVILMLSMPWPDRIGELVSFPWHPAPITFFYGYLLLTCIVALNRGAAVEPLYRVRLHTLVSLPLQLLLALALVLPYMVFMRVLTPETKTTIPLLALYVTLVGTMLAGVSFCVELACIRRGISSSLVRLGVVASILGLPLLALALPSGGWRWLALLSPLQALARLNAHASPLEAFVSFVVPLGGAMVAFVLAWRRVRSERYA